MQDLIQTFSFNDQSQIRVISEDLDNPLFVAKDIVTTLGYKRSSDAYKQFCKGAVKHRPLMTTRGKQNLRVIHEPDVYRLIFGSKLKSATQFQDWVFEKVLPSIRKTGKYQQRPEPIRIERDRPFPNGQFILSPSQMENNGWDLSVNKLLGQLSKYAGQEVIINPEPLEIAQLELRSIMHWMATYRQRLNEINRLSAR